MPVEHLNIFNQDVKSRMMRGYLMLDALRLKPNTQYLISVFFPSQETQKINYVLYISIV
jgi:hypothetical protein